MTIKPRKQTKTGKVLDTLRQDIVSGYFQPGQKLQMDDLKTRYNVGYSPLREALSRLVSHGLVNIEEQCGFTVAPLSLNELYDLYSVRVAIEIQALELSMKNGDDNWEGEVLAVWHRYKKYLKQGIDNKFDTTAWDALQKEYRFVLIKACQSPWLLKIREMLNDQALRYRFVCLNNYFSNKKILSEFMKENEKLVLAVIARDTDKAIKLTKASWDSSVKLIAKALQERLAKSE
jgi:GntR family carbon starvation induced transcriptional regulator